MLGCNQQQKMRKKLSQSKITELVLKDKSCCRNISCHSFNFPIAPVGLSNKTLWFKHTKVVTKLRLFPIQFVKFKQCQICLKFCNFICFFILYKLPVLDDLSNKSNRFILQKTINSDQKTPNLLYTVLLNKS